MQDHILTPPFRLMRPASVTSGVVFSSPHSGCDYPLGFVQSSRLDRVQLRSSEDAFVDDLFAAAPEFGAPLLAATAPRAFVDVNRSADELDPALIEGTVSRGANPRVAAGLGVIPRVVSEGRVIRHGKITRAEADKRIAQFYRPYHVQLQDLLDTAKATFGECLLVDCHSTPHEALGFSTGYKSKKPNLVIGDRFGSSCNLEIVDEIEAIFARAGFRVARNTPFAGAFITQHYGRPSAGRHAVQIEVDRALYMDEARLIRRADFAEVKSALTGAVADLCDILPETRLMAAE